MAPIPESQEIVFSINIRPSNKAFLLPRQTRHSSSTPRSSSRSSGPFSNAAFDMSGAQHSLCSRHSNAERVFGIVFSLLKSAAGIAAVEEEGLGPEEFVPEDKRVRMCDVTFDLQKKTAWAQCGQILAGTNEFTNLKETSFSW